MKLRMDFVTNSSSSCFILARREPLNEKQKEKILAYVENEYLGGKILSPENTKEEIQKVCDEEHFGEEEEKAIKHALRAGKNIYLGCVHFEDPYDTALLYEVIWDIMRENDDGDFEKINTDLDY